MTRFQRLHLTIGLAALAVVACMAAARAQTFEEAVRANLAVAAEICMTDRVSGPEMRAQAFRQSGFAERVEYSTGNSDVTHWFTAPGETAGAELSYGETPEYCAARTRHLGVSGASAVLDAVVPRVFPGYARIEDLGPVNPATGQPARCVRYEDPTNPIGHVVGVSDGVSGCNEIGTSLIFSSYRV